MFLVRGSQKKRWTEGKIVVILSRKRGLGSDGVAENYSITFMATRINIHGTMFIHSVCFNVDSRADLAHYSLPELSDLTKPFPVL